MLPLNSVQGIGAYPKRLANASCALIGVHAHDAPGVDAALQGVGVQALTPAQLLAGQLRQHPGLVETAFLPASARQGHGHDQVRRRHALGPHRLGQNACQ